MKTMPCEIISPEKLFLRDEAEFLVMPGTEGELGVLPGHARLVAMLKAGTVRFVKGGETRKIGIAAGFVLVEPGLVKIFTSSATAE
ncbi:MAG: ATP synthase F1 subunit epsilon [Chitinispirillaceae bacterium]|jgi:F-type H+-transporting ATPase subunit epsilon|nr:ATP synthase F1 subunit epsilon [Chitinispirillaceae bacterium]